MTTMEPPAESLAPAPRRSGRDVFEQVEAARK